MKERYFITGATGLIGSALVEYLADRGECVVAFVRNTRKAEQLFSTRPEVVIVEGNLEASIAYAGDIDYIIHAAAPTGSDFFVEHPVETIDSIVLGTKSVLEFAKSKKIKSVVYLSSMEVYGTPTNEEDLTENEQFYLNPVAVRSSYPMSKRLAETMCVAYALEYTVPVKIARLAQTLGKKLLPDDNRVIAQCIRAAKSGRDIVLATDGATRQTYVAIDDAISGILAVLHDGTDGQAYNVANSDTYCSIREMAEMVAHEVAGSRIKVKVGTEAASEKYPSNRTLRVNADKLQGLGWRPSLGLRSALIQLADSWEM